MQNPFEALSTVKLTSAVTNSTLVIPNAIQDVMIYNGAANAVYFRFNPAGDATVAAVPTGTLVDRLGCIPPGLTKTFEISPGGSTLNYIADTAGGVLVVSLGEGN